MTGTRPPAGTLATGRNGTRAKTVLTEVGPVDIQVPRDRDASFTPATVPKRVRRLRGVDEMVISLVARGMSTGGVQAHLGRGLRHERVPAADHGRSPTRWWRR